MSTKTLLTADEFELMPDDDSARFELDEGELITMALAGENHGYLGGEITRILGNYVKEHRLGRVYPGDTGFRLSDDTVRGPDVSFVRQARVPSIKGTGFARGTPDLAVEIVSPSNSFPQLMRKTRQYFKAGCHTVWIVYPDQREIHVQEASGGDRILHDGDILEAPDLLPGFSIRVAEIFE